MCLHVNPHFEFFSILDYMIRKSQLNTKLWIDYRKKEALLLHYERMGLVSKERIFAEADMFRAAEKILIHALNPFKFVPHMNPHHQRYSNECQS